MNYNETYLNLKYLLIKHLLIPVPSNVFDISYSVEGRHVQVQFIIENGTCLDVNYILSLQQENHFYVFKIQCLNLTKESFNENIDESLPKNYVWLQYLLFSRSEA